LARPHDEGAVHMLEAIMASVLVVAALVYVNTSASLPVHDHPDDLKVLSADVLNVLQYRANSLEHPGLGFALSSPGQWHDSSGALGADIGRMLPGGVYYYLETPYGGIGQRPADGMEVLSRPFVACGGDGKMLDCRMVLWRA
jgi:hypothetical protein